MKRIALILLVLVTSLAIACAADEETKQGGAGEYCNDSDLDCRPNHICDRGTCRIREIDGFNCESMCQKIEACDATSEDCLGKCLATIDGSCPQSNPCPWSDDAVEAFGTCIVDQLTCDQIINDNAPQICYQEIPLDQARAEVCNNFSAAIDICAPGTEDQAMLEACLTLARTTTEASWQRVFECTARINDGYCVEIGDCLNQIFLLEPPLDLGDDQIDFGPPLD